MSNFEKMQARLAAGETVLIDGGMGSEFERRGLASPTTWSGGPMITHPELVREVHEEYIKAGAEIIITNSFSTGRDMLALGGLEHKVAESNKLSIDMAVQARKNAGEEDSVVIAASVSTMAPKGQADVPVPYERALETYREQLGELAKGGPDVAVGEMLIRDIGCTLAVIDAAKELGLPVVGRTLPGPGWRRALPWYPEQARHRDPSGRHGRHQGQGHRRGVRYAHPGRRHRARVGDRQEELVGNLRGLRPFPRPQHFLTPVQRPGPTAISRIRQGLARTGCPHHWWMLRNETRPHPGAQGMAVRLVSRALQAALKRHGHSPHPAMGDRPDSPQP